MKLGHLFIVGLLCAAASPAFADNTPSADATSVTLSYSTDDPYSFPSNSSFPIVDQTKVKDTFGISVETHGFLSLGITHFRTRSGEGNGAFVSLKHKDCELTDVTCTFKLSWDDSPEASSVTYHGDIARIFHIRRNPTDEHHDILSSTASLGVEHIDGHGAATVLQSGVKLAYRPINPLTLTASGALNYAIDSETTKPSWGLKAEYMVGDSGVTISAGYVSRVVFANGDIDHIDRTATFGIQYKF